MSEETKIGETCYVFGHTMRVGKVVDAQRFPQLQDALIYFIRFDDGPDVSFPESSVFFTKLDALDQIAQNIAYWQHEEHKMEVKYYGYDIKKP